MKAIHFNMQKEGIIELINAKSCHVLDIVLPRSRPHNIIEHTNT